jgi:GT2 family glycosyltransferase
MMSSMLGDESARPEDNCSRVRVAMRPTVSIIWLNFNGARHVHLWQSVFEEEYPAKEVIFVDNGSSDESFDQFRQLSSRYPGVITKTLRLPKNVGYSMANNLGFEAATGEYICLLSNDVGVSSNWIEPALRVFDSDPTIAIAGSLLRRADDISKLDPMGNFIDVFGFNHPFRFRGEPIQEVFYSEGAVMFIRRSVVERLGYLFPADYFMMFEDVDLCWRSALLGYRTVIATESVAYHVRGGTVPGIIMKSNPEITRRGTRNRVATLFSNYGARRLVMFVPTSVGLEICKALLLEFRGSSANARATLGGLVAFIRDIWPLSERRARVQKTRTVLDSVACRDMLGPAEGLRSSLVSWIAFARNEGRRPGR